MALCSLQKSAEIALPQCLKNPFRGSGLSDAAIDAWRLPVLVLRMSTLDIDSERDRMQAEVREILAVTP